jgi:hypothetical protein
MSAISALTSMHSAGPSVNHSAAKAQQLADQLSSASQPGTGVGASGADQSELRTKFDSFVGQSFYGQLLHEMHKTVGKPAYMYGGRAEEAFQGQLDQMLSEKMSQANASQFSGPMFDLFNLQLQSAGR